MSAFHHPLLELPKFGDGVGLHRVAWLMDHLGIAPADVAERAIVVTGSNGKGSTAKIASALMGAIGGPVGLFTSPHLFRFNERFQLDDTPVSDADLSVAMDKVALAVSAYARHRPDRVGAFEAQFITALELFRDARWLVLEAGIGGRYDPVRLARAPVAALVSLDLEHTDLLGQTLADIAYDKLDAAAPGGVCVLGESALPLREEVDTYAALRDIETRFVTGADWTDHGLAGGRQSFDLSGLTGLTSSLIGRHQINNHAVAVAVCRERLLRSGIAPPDAAAWRAAIAGVTWPGRLQRITEAPPVVIDVGHTPEGVRAALGGFQRLGLGDDAVLVAGVSSNKDAAGIFSILAPAFPRIIAAAAHHKGTPPAVVASQLRLANHAAQITEASDMADAVAQVRGLGRPTYVAGGLFLAVEFAAAWRGENPNELRFF